MEGRARPLPSPADMPRRLVTLGQHGGPGTHMQRIPGGGSGGTGSVEMALRARHPLVTGQCRGLAGSCRLPPWEESLGRSREMGRAQLWSTRRGNNA